MVIVVVALAFVRDGQLDMPWQLELSGCQVFRTGKEDHGVVAGFTECLEAERRWHEKAGDLSVDHFAFLALALDKLAKGQPALPHDPEV